VLGRTEKTHEKFVTIADVYAGKENSAGRPEYGTGIANLSITTFSKLPTDVAKDPNPRVKIISTDVVGCIVTQHWALYFSLPLELTVQVFRESYYINYKRHVTLFHHVQPYFALFSHLH
jgi:hypothetical protein